MSLIEWNSSGQASERVISFRTCPNKNESMRGVDGYGPVTWQCGDCNGHGHHQNVTDVRFMRRPEYDAPTPEHPRIPLTGEILYNAFRTKWNVAAAKRAHQAALPRWKALKPWVTGVWNKTADALNKEVR